MSAAGLLPVPDGESEVLEPDPAVNGREDDLARIDSASKATDSDVEAARAKSSTSKKAKKKKSKKGGGEQQAVI